MTDFELIIAAKADPDAADRFIRQMEPLAMAACRDLYLAGGDQDDLEQEARIAILKAIRTFDPDRSGPVGGYVWMCVRRSLYSALKVSRSQKREVLTNAKRVVLNENHELQDAIDFAEDGRADTEAILDAREEIAALSTALRTRLSRLESASLLAIANGVRYDMIAERLGVTKKAIDNAQQRALTKLDDHRKATVEYRCPQCGGATRRHFEGAGRPPRCNVCAFRKLAA